MAPPIIAAVAVVSRFLLTNSMKKAIKKYGREAVDKTLKSKKYKNILKKSGASKEAKDTQKSMLKFYGGVGTAATAITGYIGYKEKNFNKEKKPIETPDKTKNPRIKNNNKLDSYIR